MAIEPKMGVRYHALKWDTQQLTSEVSKIEVGLKIMISFKCERLATFYLSNRRWASRMGIIWPDTRSDTDVLIRKWD